MSDESMSVEWRSPFQNNEINELHAECFNHKLDATDWDSQLHRHSLGWVCARHDDNLIGFVNIAWDGGKHAFVLDLMVTASCRRQGIARLLMEEAVKKARDSGCEWLHVDFEEPLKGFYLDAVGFQRTDAGLIRL